MEFTGGLVASDTTNGVRSNTWKSQDGQPFMATTGTNAACFQPTEFYQGVTVRSGNDLTMDGGALNANTVNAHQGNLSLSSATNVI